MAARSSIAKRSSPARACVLAVGGLDPGGGAGVLADSRAIVRAGAFPCAAVSVLTVQSTSGLRSASPVPTRELVSECEEVLENQRVRAIKLGALGNSANARAMGDLLASRSDLWSVVDTVMLPSSGRARLLDERAVAMLRDRVLPHATLVTANAPEAEVLIGTPVTRLAHARDAALAILALGPRGALVKGGHLRGVEAVDILAHHAGGRTRMVELRMPRLRVGPVRGTGCALASLIAARLANGYPLLAAVRWAKRAHHAAIAGATDVGGKARVLFANTSPP